MDLGADQSVTTSSHKALAEVSERQESPNFQLLVPCDDEAAIGQTLEAISWCEKLRTPPPVNLRRVPRFRYTEKALLIVGKQGKAAQKHLVGFAVWCRDLSRRGMGVISSARLAPVEHSGAPVKSSETILLEELIQIGHVCRCGLIAQNASVLWIDGRVVRMRKLPNSLLELGISFLRRAQASELPPINPGNPGIMKKGSTAE